MDATRLNRRTSAAVTFVTVDSEELDTELDVTPDTTPRPRPPATSKFKRSFWMNWCYVIWLLLLTVMAISLIIVDSNTPIHSAPTYWSTMECGDAFLLADTSDMDLSQLLPIGSLDYMLKGGSTFIYNGYVFSAPLVEPFCKQLKTTLSSSSTDKDLHVDNETSAGTINNMNGAYIDDSLCLPNILTLDEKLTRVTFQSNGSGSTTSRLPVGMFTTKFELIKVPFAAHHLLIWLEMMTLGCIKSKYDMYSYYMSHAAVHNLPIAAYTTRITFFDKEQNFKPYTVLIEGTYRAHLPSKWGGYFGAHGIMHAESYTNTNDDSEEMSLNSKATQVTSQLTHSPALVSYVGKTTHYASSRHNIGMAHLVILPPAISNKIKHLHNLLPLE